MVALRKFQNLIELLTYFKDEQTCRDYLELIRWNGKIICPYKECKHDHVFKMLTPTIESIDKKISILYKKMNAIN